MLKKKDPNLMRKRKKTAADEEGAEPHKKKRKTAADEEGAEPRKKKREKNEKANADVEATSHAAVKEAGLPDETQANREAAAGEEVGSPSKKAWRPRANKAKTHVKADVGETAEAVTDPYIGPTYSI